MHTTYDTVPEAAHNGAPAAAIKLADQAKAAGVPVVIAADGDYEWRVTLDNGRIGWAVWRRGTSGRMKFSATESLCNYGKSTAPKVFADAISEVAERSTANPAATEQPAEQGQTAPRNFRAPNAGPVTAQEVADHITQTAPGMTPTMLREARKCTMPVTLYPSRNVGRDYLGHDCLLTTSEADRAPGTDAVVCVYPAGYLESNTGAMEDMREYAQTRGSSAEEAGEFARWVVRSEILCMGLYDSAYNQWLGELACRERAASAILIKSRDGGMTLRLRCECGREHWGYSTFLKPDGEQYVRQWSELDMAEVAARIGRRGYEIAGEWSKQSPDDVVRHAPVSPKPEEQAPPAADTEKVPASPTPEPSAQASAPQAPPSNNAPTEECTAEGATPQGEEPDAVLAGMPRNARTLYDTATEHGWDVSATRTWTGRVWVRAIVVTGAVLCRSGLEESEYRAAWKEDGGAFMASQSSHGFRDILTEVKELTIANREYERTGRTVWGRDAAEWVRQVNGVVTTITQAVAVARAEAEGMSGREAEIAAAALTEADEAHRLAVDAVTAARAWLAETNGEDARGAAGWRSAVIVAQKQVKELSKVITGAPEQAEAEALAAPVIEAGQATRDAQEAAWVKRCASERRTPTAAGYGHLIVMFEGPRREWTEWHAENGREGESFADAYDRWAAERHGAGHDAKYTLGYLSASDELKAARSAYSVAVAPHVEGDRGERLRKWAAVPAPRRGGWEAKGLEDWARDGGAYADRAPELWASVERARLTVDGVEHLRKALRREPQRAAERSEERQEADQRGRAARDEARAERVASGREASLWAAAVDRVTEARARVAIAERSALRDLEEAEDAAARCEDAREWAEDTAKAVDDVRRAARESATAAESAATYREVKRLEDYVAEAVRIEECAQRAEAAQAEARKFAGHAGNVAAECEEKQRRQRATAEAKEPEAEARPEQGSEEQPKADDHDGATPETTKAQTEQVYRYPVPMNENPEDYAARDDLDGRPVRCPKCRQARIRIVPGGDQCGNTRCGYVLGSWSGTAWVDGYTFTTRNGVLSYRKKTPKERGVGTMADVIRSIRRGSKSATGWFEGRPDGADGTGPILHAKYPAPHASAIVTYSPDDGARYLLTVTAADGAQLLRAIYKNHGSALSKGRTVAEEHQGTAQGPQTDQGSEARRETPPADDEAEALFALADIVAPPEPAQPAAALAAAPAPDSTHTASQGQKREQQAPEPQKAAAVQVPEDEGQDDYEDEDEDGTTPYGHRAGCTGHTRWLYLAADETHHIRHYLTCDCHRERLGNFHQTAPLLKPGRHITTARTAQALALADRNSCDVTGEFITLDERTMRAPITWRQAKTAAPTDTQHGAPDATACDAPGQDGDRPAECHASIQQVSEHHTTETERGMWWASCKGGVDCAELSQYGHMISPRVGGDGSLCPTEADAIALAVWHEGGEHGPAPVALTEAPTTFQHQAPDGQPGTEAHADEQQDQDRGAAHGQRGDAHATRPAGMAQAEGLSDVAETLAGEWLATADTWARHVEAAAAKVASAVSEGAMREADAIQRAAEQQAAAARDAVGAEIAAGELALAELMAAAETAGASVTGADVLAACVLADGIADTRRALRTIPAPAPQAHSRRAPAGTLPEQDPAAAEALARVLDQLAALDNQLVIPHQTKPEQEAAPARRPRRTPCRRAPRARPRPSRSRSGRRRSPTA
ncbi:hypothetical protein, partial [Streptomyces decoyicus]